MKRHPLPFYMIIFMFTSSINETFFTTNTSWDANTALYIKAASSINNK